jgi:cysteine desulfurase
VTREVLYLDWNATTPPHPDVIAAMQAAVADGWANPASLHASGRRARAYVDAAREAVGALLGLSARDVTLTSGGTEANNLALASAFAGHEGGALVTSRIEHPSVVRAAEALAERGAAVEWIPPEPSGCIATAAVEAALDRVAHRGAVRLVSVQAVNHETGVIQPIAALAAIAHGRGALLHVDAVQAVGKLDSASWAGADLVTMAAHKIRGPKGVGALATRPGLALTPILRGGSQERGVRPGTQDPVACAGLAAAAERARGGAVRYAAIAALRDRLEASLEALGARYGAAPERNGTAPRVPHVTNLSWTGWRGDELCAALDLERVAVSSGAACSAGTSEPSAVITAMLGIERARSAVRVALGDDTNDEVIDGAIAAWDRVLARAAPKRSPSA